MKQDSTNAMQAGTSRIEPLTYLRIRMADEVEPSVDLPPIRPQIRRRDSEAPRRRPRFGLFRRESGLEHPSPQTSPLKTWQG